MLSSPQNTVLMVPLTVSSVSTLPYQDLCGWGSVLGVPSEGHPEVLESNSEGITRWPVVYFKVKKVCGYTEEEEDQGPYLANTVHTSLYMGDSTNSLAPCSLVGEEPSLWTSLSPPGLSSTVDQFSIIIQPHMNERFKVDPSVSLQDVVEHCPVCSSAPTP
ncbi:peroxisomal ATPase PEX6-like isoform 1-T1 [Salvelinus alpinus]